LTIEDSDKLSDSKTVVKGAAVNSLGMLARASRVAFTVFVTRVSGPATFGLFTLAAAVTEVATRFCIFGMDKSLLKFIPEARTTGQNGAYRIQSAAFRTGSVLAVLLTVSLVWSAPWIADVWLDKPQLTFPLQLIALSILPLTLANLVLAATKALKIMSYDAVVTGVVFPLLLLVLSVPILWTANPTVTLALAYTGAAVVAAIVALAFYRRHFPIVHSFFSAPRGTLRRMLSFSTPLGLHDFVQYLAIKLEIVVVAVFVTPVDLGVYAVAVEVAFVIKKFRQVFDPILIPLMSEAHGEQRMLRMKANVARVMRWVLMLGVAYVGSVMLFAEPILRIFGGEFSRGTAVLAVLCGAHLINASTGLLDMAMMVSGRPRVNLLNVCIVLVVQTGLNIWLVPRHGIGGAAIAALAAFVSVGVIRTAQSLLILRMNPFSWAQLKPLIAGLGGAVAVVGIRALLLPAGIRLPWPVLLGVFVLLYSLLLWSLGFEEEDRRMLRGLRK
jgi:O-antigen/teichoic acid export membrane protein